MAHPIHDTWFLAPSKLPAEHKYYGAYPNGFLQRARVLLMAAEQDPVLHVCSGKVEHYPNSGFGLNDGTVDLDPALEPDWVADATERLPWCPVDPWDSRVHGCAQPADPTQAWRWRACLADPPYTPEDAKHYAPATYPDPKKIVLNMLDVVPIGCNVGMLHCIDVGVSEKRAKIVANISVQAMQNTRRRVFKVWQRLT